MVGITNPEEIKAKKAEYARNYYAKNLEKCRESNRKSEEKRRSAEYYLAYRRQWVKDNPEKWRKYVNKYKEKYPFARLLISLRIRAKKMGFEHDLTLEWARNRWTGCCELTGAKFVQKEKMQNAFSASLDRIDSSKGYTQDNCRFVLWAVNRFRSDEGDDVMMEIAKMLVKNV